MSKGISKVELISLILSQKARLPLNQPCKNGILRGHVAYAGISEGPHTCLMFVLPVEVI